MRSSGTSGFHETETAAGRIGQPDVPPACVPRARDAIIPTTMRRSMPPLNPLHAFEAAARHLSFTKAAAEMNVTQGAVSRQVKALEDHLGFELFTRTPAGIVLTPGGYAYAAALTDAFDRVARATDELVTARSHTVLTIRSYTTFLVRWLIPLLPDFHVKHPNIEVRLVSASDPVDFQRDNVDLAIRYGSGRWRSLESDLLLTDELFPVCSPKLAAEAGLSSPADLGTCTLLHLKLRRADWPDWLAEAGYPALEPANHLFLEDLGVVYQCAIAGLGVAIGQAAYVADELAMGRLVAPFDAVLRRTTGYYLVCPKERVGVTKIATFRRWLRDVVGRTSAD
jgi:LysR family transcriptional regulator, glycine cleavage system transcriptional activator